MSTYVLCFLNKIPYIYISLYFWNVIIFPQWRLFKLFSALYLTILACAMHGRACLSSQLLGRRKQDIASSKPAQSLWDPILWDKSAGGIDQLLEQSLGFIPQKLKEENSYFLNFIFVIYFLVNVLKSMS
jgi:hypothetical protein